MRARRGRRCDRVGRDTPPLIVGVREGSVCAGNVRAGDCLMEIGGRRPRDILDYLEACEGNIVSLRLRREEREILHRVRKEPGVPLGLVFEHAVFDGVRTCRNRCIFCFVDQMPPGLRASLYLKDDDYRLSFYHGNFVTLNNLERGDLERIKNLRLSPLYVSLHSTHPGLRSMLMGGDARRGLDALKGLLEAGIEVHLQVVVCPDINDGKELHRTLQDVMQVYPAASLGVVPVGLTSHTSGLPRSLRPNDKRTAMHTIEVVEEYQSLALDRHGRHLFYAADELYLLAESGFPPARAYEGYPQLENGIGMVRKLLDEVCSCEIPVGRTTKKGRGILTGTAARGVVESALRGSGHNGVEVVGVESLLLGGTVTAAALLAGSDIIRALEQREPAARELLIPESMLRDGAFIDDLTPGEVGRATPCSLIPVEVSGSSLLRALGGEEG